LGQEQGTELDLDVRLPEIITALKNEIRSLHTWVTTGMNDLTDIELMPTNSVESAAMGVDIIGVLESHGTW
jgi:hypothetical protein